MIVASVEKCRQGLGKGRNQHITVQIEWHTKMVSKLFYRHR